MRAVLPIKVSAEEREVLLAGAGRRSRKLSTFIREAALEVAWAELRERERVGEEIAAREKTLGVSLPKPKASKRSCPHGVQGLMWCQRCGGRV